MFNYQGFNLSITTPFECPELLDADVKSELFPPVTVCYGNVPDHLDDVLNSGPIFEATNDHFLMRIQNVGKYLIRNGNEIIIDPDVDATEDVLRLFLLGSAFGALLNQRGYFVLHASAIATGKGAVLFTGNSGAGKSTTVQGCIDRGYKKMSDDTIVLYYDVTSKKMMALPSFPNTKLWQESADILGKKTDNLSRIRPSLNKFNLSTKEHFFNEPLELAMIYQLVVNNGSIEIKLEDILGMEKFKTLSKNTYRQTYADNLLHKQNHFTIISHIAKGYPIKQLNRPRDLNTLSEVLNTLVSDFNK